MDLTFLGVGWNYPIEFERGSVKYAAYEESVRQAIWIILETAPGERVMRPKFGCGLHDYVFGLQIPATWASIASAARRALVQWEPRIEVLSTDAKAGKREGEILLNIDYRIIATNTSHNLVYPFYLDAIRR